MWKYISKLITVERFFIFLAWFVPLFFYLLAISPSIQLEDAGELSTAALTFGVPHPSGYPVYSILVWLFSKLIGIDAFTVNLFSALMSALACYYIFKIIKYLGGKDIPALAAVWLFAFYPSIWSSSLVAEVYTLHAVFVALAFYQLVKFIKEKNITNFYWLCFITGLGIGNHLMMVWLVFMILAGLIYHKSLVKAQDWLKGILLGLLGLSFYIYLPLASLSGATMNWGDPSTWSNFFNHVFRLGYHDISVTNLANQRWLLVAGMLKQWLDGLGWSVVLMILLGAGAMVIKNKWRWLVWLVGLVCLQTLPVFVFRGIGWSLDNDYIYSYYWSGALIGLLVIFGLVISELYDYIIERGFFTSEKYLNYIAVFILFASLPWAVWYTNFTYENYHNDSFPHQYAKDLLVNLPIKSVLYVGGRGINRDSLLFTISYVQLVDNIRPDVLIIDDNTIYKMPTELRVNQFNYESADLKKVTEVENKSLQTLLKYAELKKLTPYTLFLSATSNDGLALKPDGYAYRVFSSVKVAAETKTNPLLLKPELWNLNREDNYSGRDYISHLLYFQSAALSTKGVNKASQAELLRAIEYDNQPFSDEYNGFVEQRTVFVNK